MLSDVDQSQKSNVIISLIEVVALVDRQLFRMKNPLQGADLGFVVDLRV